MVIQTHCIILEGPANALATNKDTTQVVVAGRNVFKIFAIEPDKFAERLNLRVGKNPNLNFSCADVVWNPVEDHILATAATNGSVVTWNLNKSSRSKQECVFQDHKRTVNKVCFHPTEPYMLLSGSQDGTMKLFDLRKKETTSTFYSLSESVRDVQFFPHQYFHFAAVQENGNVQLWDLRRTDKFERQFTAHNGPVFTCDFHPEDKRWLATAGRDKTIKVWDISLKPCLEHFIQTIASVSRVKWRPQRKFHIASSSLVVDFTVNIWDVRRPYVPFASFTEHKDVATDSIQVFFGLLGKGQGRLLVQNDMKRMCLVSTDAQDREKSRKEIWGKPANPGFVWRNDPHVILTTSKDCTLYQHAFEDAVRPADCANPVGLDIHPMGEVMYAVSEKIIGESTVNMRGANLSSTRFHTFFRKGPNLSEQFRSASSAMMILRSAQKHLSMEWFIQSAQNYQLHGKSVAELCEHNADVALKLQRYQVAQTWLILKMLYSLGSTLISDYSNIGFASGDKGTMEEKALENEIASQLPSQHDNGNISRNHHNNSKVGSRHVSGGGGSNAANDRPGIDTSCQTEEDTDSVTTDHESTITNIANELAQGDFFFGDGEMELFHVFDYNQLASLPAEEDWTLPREAFNLRHPLGDCSPPPETENMPSSPLSAYNDEPETDLADAEGEDQTRRLATSMVPSFPPWNFTGMVVDMLHFYAKQGDVQMSVSVLLILGDKLKEHVEESIQEQWFHSYIDLLSRYQLWNVATEVIRLSHLPNVSSLNQQSTVVHTQCGNCKRPIIRTGWFCDNCKEMTSICSLCHQVVRGLYVWCQGCAHGGHLQHLQEWFQQFRECPTGCGHLCEFT